MAGQTVKSSVLLFGYQLVPSISIPMCLCQPDTTPLTKKKCSFESALTAVDCGILDAVIAECNFFLGGGVSASKVPYLANVIPIAFFCQLVN